MSNRFLLDANSLITPYRQYYSFDLAPSYWEFISAKIRSSEIIIIDRVKYELDRGHEGDLLREWTTESTEGLLLHTINTNVFEAYGKLMEHVRSCELYTESAFHEFAQGGNADAWLVSTALAFGYTVVTFEDENSPTYRSKAKRVKIPNICSDFEIECIGLFEMLRRIQMRL